ncbi:hypothetical protein BG000_001614 [Podila horticola]|nr:hypothetical protein BG000_001614 [Podila horticola]
MQLGIYDEFVKLGKPASQMETYTESLQLFSIMNYSEVKTLGGTPQFSISRPDLYGLLYRQVPPENIHLGKRILSFMQTKDGVTINCSDNYSYRGDILVGADGAYSAVRQHMYKELKAVGKLPSCDDVSLPFNCVCLVGQTLPLDPEDFPELKMDRAQFTSVLGTENRCTFLDKDSSKRNDSFRNSEWGPEAADALCREARVLKIPGGKDGVVTLGTYIDKSPREYVSKVMLEEIVFDTWYSGRAVLMGDACHKMNPCGGAGALNAIHDAVTLANWISTLRLASVSDMEKVFKEYRKERYPIAKENFANSQMFAHNFGKNTLSVMIRAFMKHMPAWLWKRICIKMISARPQAAFLPLVEDLGTVKPMPQRSLR